jgi:NYN domain/OST-HTH/LOTUS domain
MSSLATQSKLVDEEPSKRLAVLIDADNAQPAVLEALLEEVATLGDAIVRRIYGDFTTPANSPWKKLLNKHAIKAIQQFAYTSRKNSTDSTMIIDAMDLLYSRRLDGFCLVTSDSDFTGLALRLREEGLVVYGFGEEKTPEAFRNACQKFFLTEILRPTSQKLMRQDSSKSVDDLTPMLPAGAKAGQDIPASFLMEALSRSEDESGWSNLGTFGSYLQKIQPDFDTRLYGYKKLSDLVRAEANLFEIDERNGPGGVHKILYVRAKNGG